MDRSARSEMGIVKKPLTRVLREVMPIARSRKFRCFEVYGMVCDQKKQFGRPAEYDMDGERYEPLFMIERMTGQTCKVAGIMGLISDK